MVDFINEVEEELRKDRYNALLKKWGPLIVLVLVGIVAFAGYLEWKKDSVSKAAQASSISFIDAQVKGSSGDIDGAIRDFNAIADVAPSGYQYLSLSQAAALELDRGNRSEAIALFTRASNAATETRHADLAKYKAATIAFNDAKYAEVESLLQDLTLDTRPYRHVARELMGHNLLKQGNEAAAIAEFRALSRDLDMPEGVKERVTQQLTLLNAMSASETASNEDDTTQTDGDTLPSPENPDPSKSTDTEE